MKEASQASGLAKTQRRLLEWISAPEGVQSALDAGGDPNGRAVTALVCGDERIGAVARLEIYANAYFFRILECLAEDFGALRSCLGTEWFHDLITAYLIAHPPSQPSLRYAGDGLATFLREAAAAEPFRRRCSLAADLARLEWALLTAFDAPDAPIVTREAIAAVAPEHFERLRFEFQPALQCLSVAAGAQQVRRAYDRGEPLPNEPFDARPTPVCVWRRKERVFHRMLDPLERDALEHARAGAHFGEICVALAEACGGDAAAGRAAALLSSWQVDGLLSRLILD